MERRRIVEETFRPGTSVARVARSHGVRTDQVYHWRRLYRAGQLEVESGDLVAVEIADVSDTPRGSWRHRPQASAEGTIDIDLGHARVRIEGAAHPDCVRAALEGLIR